MDMNYAKKVDGIDKGEIILFTLSTCGWCQKTKTLLKQLGVKYYYIDMDSLDWDTLELAEDEIRKHTAKIAYPTAIINSEECIVGYDPDRLRELFM